VLILAVDTAGERVGVAVGRGPVVIGAVTLDGRRRHAEQLVPAVRYLFRELGLKPGQLAAVAVGTGPGLFTGLRVGITTATAMASALRIPVVGIPSLDLVAYPLRHATRTIAAVLDARRHEVFWALYEPVPGGIQRVSEYEVGSPDTLGADLTARPGDHLVAGSGALAYADLFEPLDHVELAGPSHAGPDATALVELAAARLEREEFSRPSEVRPLYLRRSDAEINWGRAAS